MGEDRRGLWRRWAAVTVGLALLLWGRSAFADLTSLVLDSEAIVRAKRQNSYFLSDANKVVLGEVANHRVLQSYVGPLAEGALLEISYTEFGFWSAWSPKDGTAPAGPDEVILFLQRPKGKPLPLEWWIAAEDGVRALVDGDVCSIFGGNPTYQPLPDGPDGDDFFADPELGGGHDLAAFEKRLRRAIARANGLRTALAEPPSAGRTQKLLALVGPPSDPDGEALPPWEYVSQRAVTLVANEFATAGDLDGLLETLARWERVELPRIDNAPDVERLLAAARDARRRSQLRVAAIRLAAESAAFKDQASTVVRKFLPLLDDPAPAVRLAAFRMPFGDVAAKEVDAARARHFKTEFDPRVRYELWESMTSGRAPEGRAAPFASIRIVSARRDRRYVSVDWTHSAETTVDRAIVEARRPGGKPRQVEIGAQSRSGSSTGGGLGGLLRFDPPLDNGRWTLDVIVDVERGGKREKRRFAVAPLTVNTTLPPPPPIAPPFARPTGRVEPPAPVASQEPAPTAVASAPPPVSPRRGCGCGIAETRAPFYPLLLLVPALVFALRRRAGVVRGRA